MTFYSRVSLTAVAAIATLLACSDTDSEPDAVVTTYAEATFANAATEAENGEISLTKVVACTVDGVSGRADFAFSNGKLQVLTLAIKGFSSTPQTYTCTQASDNATSSASLGLRFDSCMVEVAHISSSDTTTANGYSMHRVSTDIKLFEYDGACSITTTSATGTVEGTISCTKMVQSVLDGTARNPIDESETADVTGEFKCKISS